MNPAARRGFTLIELLVVITVISILVLIGLAIYTNAGQKTRDAKRKDDLRNIAQALEIYYQVNKRYPRTGGTYTSASTNLSSVGGWWITDNGTSPSPIPFSSSYIDILPTDPKPVTGNPFGGAAFTYAYWSGSVSGSGCPVDATGGQYFVLAATLENQNDADRNSLKTYRNCAGNQIIPTATNPNAFVVTSPQ